MNVDVRWRGDAAPIDGIRFRGMENEGSSEAGNGYAAQQGTAHLFDPSETPLTMLGEVGGKAKAPNFSSMSTLALGMTPPCFHVRIRYRRAPAALRRPGVQSTFIRSRVLRNTSLAFFWLAGSVPITADCGTWNGNVGPGCFSQPAAGAVFELSLHRSTRSTTMFRGIAIALFGLTILSQVDQALFYGRNTDAALKLVREIGRGFGL
ncbi:hypothetical protein [Bradyrhizobium frederickii]|uniref:hypothetical protein n=1 Tax=Bradyrhizobium frederickii TaxID=2560054 RepID=UPI001430EDEC|nr:hypothetical protein [Bradyrhizobium frederickii]